ncbi:AAA family ATPase, partial [Candidatus Dependentiae bacterium]|nr:AAA family ATPase [Candidatus Dependentiae bacterium]
MIRRLLPEFIESKFLEGKQVGKLSGSIISIDIKGFTPLTDELMNQGSQGIEILSEILNQVFSPIINLVYSNGGWVTHFAGDALSAFFKGMTSDEVVEVIDLIQEEFELHNNIKTAVGNFKLDIRIGLASGTINWGIVTCEPYNLFYFKGSPLDQSTLYTFSRTKYPRKNLQSRTSIPINIPIIKTKVKTLKKFFPGVILKIKSSGEFREIVSVFISFKSQQSNFKKFIKKLSGLTEKYKGYLNKIAFGNKGGVALIIFGAPVAIENAVAHALNLTSELQHNFPGLKISVTKGRAFAGFMGSSLRSEYTCIGKTVNLSARFLEKAKPGTILVDKNIFESGSSEFYFTGLGRIPIRGFKGKVPLYLLNGKKKKLKDFFQGRMIGREAELKRMYKYTDLITQGEFGGIIYIEGEGGIGKSRLLERFKTNLKNENFNWFYLPCDEIVRESFNPFIYFLKSYFNQDEDIANLQNKNNFEKQFKFLISNCPNKEIVTELKRTKSILSQLVNIHVKDSLYDKLDSKGKYENLKFAIKNLIKAASLLKPTIIELDDSHWIDPDSINLIKVLINNVQGFPFLIISEFRRYESGKVFNDLFINTASLTINLKRFTLSLTRALIEDRLKEKVTDNLVKVIWKKSEGIPFYIEQLISYLDETGALIKVKKRIGLSLEKINIPGEISSIIIARVDKLKYHLRDLIKNASVLGKEFSVRVLSKMLKGRVIEKNLKDIESEAIWSPLNELTYIFKSALIRDTVYEMQLKKTLRNLHQLAAEAIERTYKKKLKPHYGELAFHFEKSANAKKSREYLLKAGDQAKKAFKNSEALEYYNRLNKYLKIPQNRIENIIKIGIMQEFLGAWNKSEKHYREALKRSITIKDSEMIARSKNSLGNLVGVRGSFYDALELIKDANKIFKKLKHKRGIVNTYGNLGVINKNLGNIK